MADGGSGGGGTTKVSDTYLTNFAQSKLDAFVEAMTNHPSVVKLLEFVNGPANSGASGGDPSGGYNALLPGNASSTALPSAAMLRSQFQKMTSTVNEQITNLSTNARSMQMDLLKVDSVLDDAANKNDITADAMSADLSNINLSGTTGGANTGGVNINGPNIGGANTGGNNTGVAATGGKNTTGGSNTGNTNTGSKNSSTTGK